MAGLKRSAMTATTAREATTSPRGSAIDGAVRSLLNDLSKT